MSDILCSHPIYSYISTLAGYDPVRTYYVCAPEEDAASLDSLARFAEVSGWREAAQQRGAVLVMPAAPGGWDALPDTLLMDIYLETRNRFQTRSGKALWGRQGGLWCWETMICLAGYRQGAAFAGRALVRCPNLFAATALVEGAPADFRAGDQPSSHWLVKNVGGDYRKRNRDIPVCLWMWGSQEQTQPAVDYFTRQEGAKPAEVTIAGHPARLWQSEDRPACQVAVFSGGPRPGPELTRLIAGELFSHAIRWKNSPDGTLDRIHDREEFYHHPLFTRHTVTANDSDYDFFVHLPARMDREAAAGLPLVFTVHGRGEPAWMFTTKNGWDRLADETGEFILVSPDSPGNIWFLDRDGAAFPAMVQFMAEHYRIDTTRVYLTGFSNGGMMARETGVRYPWLFAGISPWNAPRADTFALRREDSPAMPDRFGPEMEEVLAGFTAGGYELPAWFCYGDNDPAAAPEENLMLETLLRANGCTGEAVALDSASQYPRGAGYQQGERFSTMAYPKADGAVPVAVTVMKEMPHGAIHDQSRAAWRFLRRFRRIEGRKDICLDMG